MRHKLLLADDSVTIQRVIELTFADEDVQVLAVGDGKKAIASIEADRPDIVLADIGMPERDGYEVAAFIKGNPQLASIPVLLLTGAFEPIDETRARAVGCDGVLVKPFEPQMVINRVKDLLAGRRPAGLWGTNPAAQGPPPHQSAPAEKPAGFRAAASHAAPAGPGGTLEDYFDRLDAAFANLEAGGQPEPALSVPSAAGVQPTAPPHQPPAAPQAWREQAPFDDPGRQRSSAAMPADILDGWDPDLAGDPKKVEPMETPAAPLAAEPPVAVQPPQPPPPVPAPAAAPPEIATPVRVAAPVSPQVTAVPHQAVVPHEAVERAEAPVAGGAAAPSGAAAPIASTPMESQPAASAAVAPMSPTFVPAPMMPTLAEAFATLLAAEQARPIAPSSIAARTVSDDTVDEIVRRVVAHMGEQAVRDTVLDVAERLVREEIDRIKSASRE